MIVGVVETISLVVAAAASIPAVVEAVRIWLQRSHGKRDSITLKIDDEIVVLKKGQDLDSRSLEIIRRLLSENSTKLPRD